MDKTAAGAAAGFAAGLVIGLISTVLNKTGICELCLINIGGGMFTRTIMVATAPAVWQVIGWLVHLTLSIVLGVILAYIIHFTGKDFALLKGAIFGAVIWVVDIGIISPLAGYMVASPQPVDLLFLFSYHVLFGLLVAALLLRYGKFAETI